MTVTLWGETLPPGKRTKFDHTDISDWHRRLGMPLQFTDIDQVWAFGSTNIPVALVEFKAFSPRDMEMSSAMTIVWNLANMAGLPGFIVFYRFQADGHPYFYVHPWNELAKQFVGDGQCMSELEYVRFECDVRRISLPDFRYSELSTYRRKDWCE